jgi:dephospho-CoA kinase
MKRIGLTGNIGTGKSTIARVFETLGVPVYHADIQAKKLLEKEDIKNQLADLFGIHVVNSQQQIDRKVLASIVFNDAEKLNQLNHLIHPLVKKDFLHWCNLQQNVAYVVHEAAILFESGFNTLFDSNILVWAPDELCISRVMQRDQVSKEMVADRMQNQWTQNRKKALANHTIINDDKTLVIPQVLAIHNNFLHGK